MQKPGMILFLKLMLCMSVILVTKPLDAGAGPQYHINDLSFLTGKWVSANGDALAEEYWSGIAGGTMICMSRLVNKDMPAIVIFRVIQQTKVGVTLSSTISAPGQESPNTTHRATLTVLESNKAIFDFDNKQGYTTYHRTSDTTLSITTATLANGSERVSVFKFRLVG